MGKQKKWKVVNVSNEVRTETIVTAESESEAYDNWVDDKNIVSEKSVEFDTGYTEVEEIK